jgi:hypothetical protein
MLPKTRPNRSSWRNRSKRDGHEPGVPRFEVMTLPELELGNAGYETRS